MAAEAWLPNNKVYENTRDRIWCHILRHTPAEAKILIMVTSQYQENIYKQSQASFDLADRQIEFCNENEMRGLDPDQYDYMLYLKPLSSFPFPFELQRCRVFYRELISPLRGEQFIEIKMQ